MNTDRSALRPPPPSAATLAALEARVALRITARLEASSQGLPHEVQERLRVARQQAVARARSTRQLAPVALAGASAASVVSVPGGSSLLSGLPSSDGWRSRLSMALPALVLVLGLLGIQEWHQREQISLAAEIDAALLGDDLPPSAYTDPGFLEYMLSAVPRSEP